MSKNKVPNEKDTRANLLGWAKKYGCFEDLQKLFAQYDDWLKSAKTIEEKRAIATLGVLAVEKFITGHSEPDPNLIIDTSKIK